VLDIRRLLGGAPVASWRDPGPGTWAYLNLTSGTTGAPRAVVISQRSLAAFLDWYGPALALGPVDRTSHLLSRSFDAALSEWLPALASGGCVVAGTPLSLLPPHRLDRELDRRQITVVTLPASYFELWSRQTGRLPRSLRRVVVGGAPLRVDSVERWRARCATAGRDVPVVNVYGPAEATIGVCAHTIEVGDLDRVREFVPVGTAAPGIEVRGPDGQHVVPGQPGELWIDGPQLMEGVWNGAALDARPSGPFATGDVATVGADGRIVVLGRRGDWVKVRGRRIQLRATEARMARAAGLAQIVLGLDDRLPEPRLVAFCVDPARRDRRELRRLITPALPAGLVPVVHRVSAIPLTAHAKADWNALLGMTARVAPIPPAVVRDTTVWALLREAMGPDLPEPDAGFYENGGDSLQALHLQALLSRRLELEVALQRILEASSLEELTAGLQAELDARR
jgi:acyl-CoA synthetase (AMP-forming)/AMP-acid ligase II